MGHNPLTRYRRLDCARWEGNEPLLAGFLAQSSSRRRRRRNVWLARELAYLTQQEREATLTDASWLTCAKPEATAVLHLYYDERGSGKYSCKLRPVHQTTTFRAK